MADSLSCIRSKADICLEFLGVVLLLLSLNSSNSTSSSLLLLLFPPSGWYFPSVEAYLEYLPDDSSNIEDEIEEADLWNSATEGAKNDGLRAYIRIFCKISVLFFVDFSLGFIMKNYANDMNPNQWTVAAQFESSFAGLVYSVSVATVIDFDRRRHLHLEGQDYHRALTKRYERINIWM